MDPQPDAGPGGAVDDQERRAPCLEVARRAAAALGEAGASRVLVYGSVARGDQHADSDIDLVAILDDLDYDKRGEVQRHLRKRAEEAAGRKVDVRATDWPEWAMRTEKVSSSFEAHIAADAVALWDREPGEVQWHKPMVKATTNLDEAAQAMFNVEHAVHWNLRRWLETSLEHPVPLKEQPSVGWEDHERVGMFCRDAALVVRRAVGVMVGLRGAYPPRLSKDLDFAGFVAALAPEMRARCDPWAAEVARIDVSGYESYCDNGWCCFPTIPGTQTVEIARTLAAAAARAAVEALEQMRRALNDAGDTTDGASWRRPHLEDDAAAVLAMLERWDPPITGDEPPAEPVGAPRAGD